MTKWIHFILQKREIKKTVSFIHSFTYQSIAPVIWEVIDPTDCSTFLEAALPRLIYNFKTSVAQF